MEKILAIFSGKKTFLVGILMIALGLLNGDTQMVMEGLGFITLRAAVTKGV